MRNRIVVLTLTTGLRALAGSAVADQARVEANQNQDATQAQARTRLQDATGAQEQARKQIKDGTGSKDQSRAERRSRLGTPTGGANRTSSSSRSAGTRGGGRKK